IDLETPYAELPEKFKKALLYGTGDQPVRLFVGEEMGEKPFEGVIPQLEHVLAQTTSEFSKPRLMSLQGRRTSKLYQGARPRPEMLAVTIQDLKGRELNI